MQLRHKKCMSVIHNHKWPLADGIASPHMDSVVPLKKAKLRQKNAVNNVQISVHQCQCEVGIAIVCSILLLFLLHAVVVIGACEVVCMCIANRVILIPQRRNY